MYWFDSCLSLKTVSTMRDLISRTLYRTFHTVDIHSIFVERKETRKRERERRRKEGGQGGRKKEGKKERGRGRRDGRGKSELMT